ADAVHGAEAGQVGRAPARDGLERAVAEDAVGRKAVAAGGLAAELAEALDERAVGRRTGLAGRRGLGLARARAGLGRRQRERDRRAVEDVLALARDGDGRVVALCGLEQAGALAGADEIEAVARAVLAEPAGLGRSLEQVLGLAREHLGD